MSKHLFIINDIGTEYQITGARMEMDTFEVDSSLYFETGSEDFYLFVKELVEGSNTVTYLKTVTPTEETDLTISPMDELTIYKSRIRTKGKHLLKQYCDFTIQFDFFQFHVLNNSLIDQGYVITDENRETKYLEIINTADDTLIAMLEAYLEIKDSISIHEHYYDNYQSFKTSVNDAVDIDAVDVLYSAYSALFG